jgi:hypothetical protein
MMPHRTVFCLFTALLLAPHAPAQRISPPPPATYDAQVRYRIRVGGNQRIVQFRDMTGYLESIGFKRVESTDPNESVDANADRISGTLPSNRVADLLREPHVKTVLLMPAGYKLPENAEQRLLVQLKLIDGFALPRQRDLFFQSLDKLRQIGFIEKVGYDHERFTRILGTIPAADVEMLSADLRVLPAGWLAPQTPIANLPDPIREVTPIRIAEVLAEPEGVPPSVDVPPTPLPLSNDGGLNALAKIAPDLRAIAAEGAAGAIRFEVVLTHTPGLDDTAWRALFPTQSDFVVEGRIGPVVSILGPATAIRTLAELPEIATVRPPRAATRQAVAVAQPPIEALAASGLDRLHKLSYRGAGIGIAMIDTDFAGLTERFGKDLAKTTTLIDLTASRNSNLLPDPPAEGVDAGRGTRLALAAHLAAPDARLFLIRIDPAAMYQVLTVARFIHGDTFRPESLADRNRELLAENNLLRVDRSRLSAEREALLNNFRQDEEYVQKRKALDERTAAFARREQQYNDRLARYYVLEAGLAELRAVNIVVCPLAWDEGYPVDGSGPLSRYLDDVSYGRARGGKNLTPPTPLPDVARAENKLESSPPSRVGKAAGGLGFSSELASTSALFPPLWFQATGNTRGQAWNGPLTDLDGNGAIEFAPPEIPLPQGRWSREINFLGWKSSGAERSVDLPTKSRMRMTFQWTEAHDQAVSNYPGPDLYRVPLADLRFLILRQRDPSGTKVGTDDFNVIARTDSLPQMIERQPSWATYEHTVEFVVDAAGPFAVRLEGTIPPTIRPPTVPSLPILDRAWEARGRLFVTATGVTGGRVVLGDYQPNLGGLGSPGNALLPRTFGAADGQGRSQPYSASGPPAGQQLMPKPTFLAFDQLALPGMPAGGGTEVSAAFAAGMYASMMSAGTIESQKLKWLTIPPGGVMRVPPVWLEQIERRWPKTGRE